LQDIQNVMILKHLLAQGVLGAPIKWDWVTPGTGRRKYCSGKLLRSEPLFSESRRSWFGGCKYRERFYSLGWRNALARRLHPAEL